MEFVAIKRVLGLVFRLLQFDIGVDNLDIGNMVVDVVDVFAAVYGRKSWNRNRGMV